MALVKNKKTVRTVGDLKKWLAKYDDDMPLCDDSGEVRISHLVPQAGEMWEDERGAIDIDNG